MDGKVICTNGNHLRERKLRSAPEDSLARPTLLRLLGEVIDLPQHTLRYTPLDRGRGPGSWNEAPFGSFSLHLSRSSPVYDLQKKHHPIRKERRRLGERSCRDLPLPPGRTYATMQTTVPGSRPIITQGLSENLKSVCRVGRLGLLYLLRRIENRKALQDREHLPVMAGHHHVTNGDMTESAPASATVLAAILESVPPTAQRESSFIQSKSHCRGFASTESDPSFPPGFLDCFDHNKYSWHGRDLGDFLLAPFNSFQL